MEGSARSQEREAAAIGPPLLYVSAMYWPLIGGFIAFVLLAVLIGWIIDSSARRAADRHEPHV
jgi:hypothetical protein